MVICIKLSRMYNKAYLSYIGLNFVMYTYYRLVKNNGVKKYIRKKRDNNFIGWLVHSQQLLSAAICFLSNDSCESKIICFQNFFFCFKKQYLTKHVVKSFCC